MRLSIKILLAGLLLVGAQIGFVLSFPSSPLASSSVRVSSSFNKSSSQETQWSNYGRSCSPTPSSSYRPPPSSPPTGQIRTQTTLYAEEDKSKHVRSLDQGRNPPARKSYFFRSQLAASVSTATVTSPFPSRFATYEMAIPRTATSTKMRLSGNSGASDERQPPLPSNKNLFPSRFEGALFVSYFTNAIVVTLPVVLSPVVASELGVNVVQLASIATLGGGLGKFINGFVCQRFGARLSSTTYLLGLASCCLLISSASYATVVAPWLFAAMEFFAAMQWPALSELLTQNYNAESSPIANGITVMSLSSTTGVLFSKFLASTLLVKADWSWQQVMVRVGTFVACIGALTVWAFLNPKKKQQQPRPELSQRTLPNFPSRAALLTIGGGRMGTQLGVQSGLASKTASSFSLMMIWNSLRSVLTNPLFWWTGLPHATTFLARQGDKILGGFFRDATLLPGAVCGGLTASITFGFIHGLVTSRNFFNIPTRRGKEQFLKRRYIMAVVSTLSLALMASPSILASNGLLKAAGIALASAVMASSLSCQFYQIPVLCSRKAFDSSNRALSLSLLDGVGFFLAAPIWAFISSLVNTPPAIESASPSLVGGWSLAWLLIATLYAAGGSIMMSKAVPELLRLDETNAHQE